MTEIASLSDFDDLFAPILQVVEGIEKDYWHLGDKLLKIIPGGPLIRGAPASLTVNPQRHPDDDISRRVFAVLEKDGPLGAKRLGEKAGVSVQSVYRLRDRGLLISRVPHPTLEDCAQWLADRGYDEYKPVALSWARRLAGAYQPHQRHHKLPQRVYFEVLALTNTDEKRSKLGVADSYEYLCKFVSDCSARGIRPTQSAVRAFSGIASSRSASELAEKPSIGIDSLLNNSDTRKEIEEKLAARRASVVETRRITLSETSVEPQQLDENDDHDPLAAPAPQDVRALLSSPEYRAEVRAQLLSDPKTREEIQAALVAESTPAPAAPAPAPARPASPARPSLTAEEKEAKAEKEERERRIVWPTLEAEEAWLVERTENARVIEEMSRTMGAVAWATHLMTEAKDGLSPASWLAFAKAVGIQGGQVIENLRRIDKLRELMTKEPFYREEMELLAMTLAEVTAGLREVLDGEPLPASIDLAKLKARVPKIEDLAATATSLKDQAVDI